LELDNGGFVVTVVTPCRASFQALLGAINRINPDAFSLGSAVELHAKAAAMGRGDPLRDDDEGQPAEPPRVIYGHTPPFVGREHG
jgi:hypothetical protein